MTWAIVIVILVLAVIILFKSVTTIHQAEKGIVERFGRYKETLDPGPGAQVPHTFCRLLES